MCHHFLCKLGATTHDRHSRSKWHTGRYAADREFDIQFCVFFENSLETLVGRSLIIFDNFEPMNMHLHIRESNFGSTRASGGPLLDPKWQLIICTCSFVEPRCAFVELRCVFVEPGFAQILMKKYGISRSIHDFFHSWYVAGFLGIYFQDDKKSKKHGKFLSRVWASSDFLKFLNSVESPGREQVWEGSTKSSFWKFTLQEREPKVWQCCSKVSLQQFAPCSWFSSF